MTRNLQPALHRAHITLTKCNPQAVVLDRHGVAWQRWDRYWWSADGIEDKRSDFELARLGPFQFIHEGVKP